jgi:hypothetical protein
MVGVDACVSVRAVMSRKHMWIAMPMLFAACSEGPPAEKEAPPQATYRYEITERWFENKPKFFSELDPILLDGKLIGPKTLLDPKEFTLPAGTKLSSGKLVMQIPSTCGTTAIPLEVEFESGKSEDEVRRESDRMVAQKTGYIIRVRVKHRGAWPVPVQPLYLDNSGGKEAATVKVGTMTFDVSAGVGPVKKEGQFTIYPGLAHRSVPVGDCAEGRTITAGGTRLGEMAKGDLGTVVDLVGGHCYARVHAIYVRKGEDPAKAPEPAKPVAYIGEDKQRVHHVPAVDVFQGGMMEKRVIENAPAYQELSELIPMPCATAKRIASLK